MDSFENGLWIIPFKKFSRLGLNQKARISDYIKKKSN